MRRSLLEGDPPSATLSAYTGPKSKEIMNLGANTPAPFEVSQEDTHVSERLSTG